MFVMSSAFLLLKEELFLLYLFPLSWFQVNNTSWCSRHEKLITGRWKLWNQEVQERYDDATEF